MRSLSDLEPPERNKGCVHLYTGDGKGKTTAAAGLAVRALGSGKSVLFCQFLKGRESGELEGLRKLGAEIMRAKCTGKFMSQMDEAERGQLARSHELCFSEVFRRVSENMADVVVLDEVVDAVGRGLIAEDELLSLIKNRPEAVELVLTGRDPSEKLVADADYHTDFVCKKHPYKSGIVARKGIEY